MVISVPARCCALAVLLAMLLAAPSAAHAAAPAASGCDVGPITNFLAADATQPGVISLVFFGARGAPVEFFECVDGRLVRLGALASSPDEGGTLRDATTWDCERPSRDFRARAVLPDGTHVAGAYAVRTGSCASRFEIRVARRVAPGRVGRVRIVDRWGIGGVSPLICISPPRGDRDLPAHAPRPRRRAHDAALSRVHARALADRAAHGLRAPPAPYGDRRAGPRRRAAAGRARDGRLDDAGHRQLPRRRARGRGDDPQRRPSRDRRQQVRLAGDRRRAGQAPPAERHRRLARRQRGLRPAGRRRPGRLLRRAVDRGLRGARAHDDAPLPARRPRARRSG